MDIFPNHEDHINSSEENIDFISNVIKPYLHGVEKMAYL
jgi:hypothetical protein